MLHADLREWRASERGRLRKLVSRYQHEGDEDRVTHAKKMLDRVKMIGRKEAERHIAFLRIMAAPPSRDWIRSTTQPLPVDVDNPRNEYGSATITMTDPATGKQRKVQVRTVRDLGSGDEAYKSDSASGTVPHMAVIRMATMFPLLSHTLFGSDDALAYAPSIHRAQVLEAMGF